MMKTQIRKLSNNIPLIVEEIPYIKNVTFGVYVCSGSSNETADNNGVAHAIEHMMFKGTKNYSGLRLADIMTDLGGGINAYTSKENTVFYGKVLAEDFEFSIGILSDMFCNSLFDEKEFAKEKSVIIDEIDSYDDSAEDMCHELLQKEIWKNNPLGYIISGNKTGVRRLKRENLITFLNDNYTADNMIISIAGNISMEEAYEICEKNFGMLKKCGKKICPQTPDFRNCFVYRHKDMEQTHLNIAFESVTARDEERYAMYLINAYLGGNLNSLLFQKVREENGLTYSIYSYTGMCDIAGLFHIYASMNGNQLYRVSELVFCIVDELYNGGITEETLKRLKKQMKTEICLGSDSTNNIVLNNAKSYQSFGKVITVSDALEGYDRVSAEQINSVIRKCLKPEKCSICVVGNPVDADVKKLKATWKKRVS